MKKLITAILILAMLLPTAAGATTDRVHSTTQMITLMDLDELYEVNQTVQWLLFNRYSQADGVRVPVGVYRVGEDIPAGSYRLEFPDAEDESMIANIFIRDQEGNTKLIYNIGKYFKVTEIGKVELKEGMTFETDIVTLFYAYTGLFH